MRIHFPVVKVDHFGKQLEGVVLHASSIPHPKTVPGGRTWRDYVYTCQIAYFDEKGRSYLIKKDIPATEYEELKSFWFTKEEELPPGGLE